MPSKLKKSKKFKKRLQILPSATARIPPKTERLIKDIDMLKKNLWPLQILLLPHFLFTAELSSKNTSSKPSQNKVNYVHFNSRLLRIYKQNSKSRTFSEQTSSWSEGYKKVNVIFWLKTSLKQSVLYLTLSFIFLYVHFSFLEAITLYLKSGISY